MKAIIPTEIGVPTLRTEIPEKTNVKAITKDLYMTDELREVAVVRIASYQQRLTHLYNRHVKLHAFRAEDLVLRMVIENTVGPIIGKFQPNWERPCTIVKVEAVGLYALDKLDGTPVPRMWNATHLKKYYQ